MNVLITVSWNGIGTAINPPDAQITDSFQGGQGLKIQIRWVLLRELSV